MDAGWCWKQTLLWNHIKDATLPPLHHQSPMETRRSYTVQEQQIHRCLLPSALMHRVRLKRCFSSPSVLIQPLWLAPCTPQPHLNQRINPGSTDFLWDFLINHSSYLPRVKPFSVGLSEVKEHSRVYHPSLSLCVGDTVQAPPRSCSTVLSHLKGDKAEFVPLLNVQWHWCTALRSIIKTSHPQWEYWYACVWCCNVLSMAQTIPLPLQWKTRARKPAACDWRETVWPAST